MVTTISFKNAKLNNLLTSRVLLRLKVMIKNILVAGLLLVTLTACSKKDAPTEAPVDQANTFEVPADALEPEFESVDYGFRVQGPDGWLKKADNLGMLVTYLKPGDPEVFQENISIAREVKGDLSFEDYVSGTMAQVEEVFAESEITEQSDLEIAGQTAKKIRFVIATEGLMLETEQIIIDRPNEFMVLTFMASPAQFANAYPAFTTLLDSLQLVGPEIGA